MPFLAALWAKLTGDSSRVVLHIITIGFLIALSVGLLKPLYKPVATTTQTAQPGGTISNPHIEYKAYPGGCIRVPGPNEKIK